MLSVVYQGMEMRSWVDSEGNLLRQETPLGWTMEACTAEEALAIDARDDPGEDILTALAAPASTKIDRPRETRRLRVRLHGMPLGGEDLQSHRQSVTLRAHCIEMTLSADRPPDAAALVGSVPDELTEFLLPSRFVEADAPEILSKAGEIVGREQDSLKAALSIHQWVFENVRKEPTVSVPTAREVLRTRRGDCNEHTTLFVALARAAGLPAKILVGLVYHEGAFFYHAWPSVYVGRWLEMDPTFGQAGVDATHIRLLEGELPDQLRLMGIVGRLRVEVLSREG
jgi:transglutaminase-like putative cysteine protease